MQVIDNPLSIQGLSFFVICTAIIYLLLINVASFTEGLMPETSRWCKVLACCNVQLRRSLLCCSLSSASALL
jgi:hypothetical protein